MIEVKTELLALCRKVESLERQSLSFSRRGPDVWPDGLPDEQKNFNNMLQTSFTLVVGYGYFQGALLEVVATGPGATTGWRRMIDRPLDEAIEMFLALTIPSADEPWSRG